MAKSEKIERWLASRRAKEMERLRQLEEDAAVAWLESLSDEQREVFAELVESTHALWDLRRRILRPRVTERTREQMKGPEGVGFR